MGNVQRRPDGRWRARYRDAAGKEHARHFDRKLDAQRWVESQETAKSRGDWIDPARARVTVGKLDAFDVDQVLFQYSRAAKELWKFCNSLQVEVAAALIRDQPPGDWCERGAPRRRL